MSPLLIVAGIAFAALASLLFSTLTYALRDFSRARLSDYLDLRNRGQWLDPIVDHANNLIFVTAAVRLLANVCVLIGMLRLFYAPGRSMRVQFSIATVITLALTLICSVAVPHAAARYAGEAVIGVFAPFLHVLRICLMPITKIMDWTDELVRRLLGGSDAPGADQIEQDILSVVEEGEKGGVVDVTEREMIESVIEFGDTTVGQIMTARPEIVGLPLGATLAEVKRAMLDSGHSRVPVYDGTLDHVAGILYARDLIKQLGMPPERFDLRATIRPALYVPETKLLQDLLEDFRSQKIHIAIVLDEYGGTAGLVTIEDILEELVGDISDEHEPAEPAMLRKVDEQTFDADARMYVDELNRQIGLSLPEDAGYDTLGGFLSTTLGRIPAKDESFEHGGAKYTITDAEPQKVNRVKIELALQPAEAPAPGTATPPAAS